ncbi:hypothetical protein ACWEQL_13215 [Kitasatospora sp. NPDC004240]
MALFRRSKKAGANGNSAVPQWCSWFGPAEWEAFQELLGDVFLDGDTSGPPMRFGDRQHLRLGAPDGPGIGLDLAEIARLVAPLPRARWRPATVEYLNGQLEVIGRRESLYRAGFDEVRHLLLARVVPVDRVDGEGELTRPLTQELATVVVLRLDGDLSAPVPDEQLRSWGVSADVVWATALENLRAEPVTLDDNGKPNPMVSVEGVDGFTCSHVLRAAELLRRPAPLGILAMLPHEGFLMLQAVEGPELHHQLIGYSSVVLDNWERAPGPQRMSSRVLWVHEGEIESVGVEPAPPGSGRPGVISGSERFITMLSTYRPPDQES